MGTTASAWAVGVSERLPGDSTQAAAWRDAGQFARVDSLLRRRTQEAEATGDVRALSRLLRMRGADLAARSQSREALAVLARCEKLALSQRDTSTLVRALRWKAYALGTLGRMEQQQQVASWQMQLASAIRDTSYLANALHSLGWGARRQGDWKQARHQLEASLRAYQAIRDEANEAYVSGTLGSLYLAVGNLPAARRTYTRALTLARKHRQAWSQAQALNDLGTIENLVGDPATAARNMRQAYLSYRAQGALVEAMLSLGNCIASEVDQGHLDDALALSQEGLALAETNQMRAQRAWFLANMAYVEQEYGRPSRAAARWRESLAAGDTIWLEDRTWFAIGLARALAAQDSLTAALDVLAGARAWESRISRQGALRLRLATARAWLQAGRPDRALALAAPTDAEIGISSLDRLASPLATVAGRALAAMGRNDEAEACFTRAAAHWERSRGATQDLGWREFRDADGVQELAAAEAELLLIHPAHRSAWERSAKAFACLQRFKTRTLLERLSAPGVATPPARPLEAPRLDVDHLQAHTLRAGELLLEISVGADSSFLFAVSREQFQLFRLPGQAELARQIELAAGVCMRRPTTRDDAAARAVLRTLRRTMRLEEALAVMPQRRSVIISPDGVLHRAPFEGMLADETAPVTRMPSAGILATLRSRPVAPVPRRMLVLMGGLRPGEHPLAGAEREARSLIDRLPDAELREADSTSVALSRPELAGFGVLHFAGHTHADDQHPWRSGVTIRSASIDADAIPLTAEEIAAQRMNAALVVLSSCESGLGRTTSGEGVAGLSTAFLAAGTQSVIATLWPVDDAATAQFVSAFYDRIGRGDAAGVALAGARAALRRSPATAHPFYWAGFVLVGESATRPPLRTRAFPRSHWPRYALGLCLLLTAICAVRGLRGQPIPRPGQNAV